MVDSSQASSKAAMLLRIALQILPHLLFVVAVIAIFWRLFLEYNGLFLFYIREDRMIECLQFYTELLCAMLCFHMALEFRRRGDRPNSVLFVLGMLGFTFIGMEEISWGQRLLQFEVPEWLAKNNVQHEATLHNIPGISNKKLHLIIGLYGVLSGLVFLFLKPFIPRCPLKFVTRLRLEFCVIPFRYTVYFVPLIMYNRLYGYLEAIYEDKRGLYFQEVAEFSFAFGCYLVLFSNLKGLFKE